MTRFTLFLSFAFFVLGSSIALAQEPPRIHTFSVYGEDPLRGRPDPETGLTYEAPSEEPDIPQVQYLKIAEARSVQERLDSLLHGITVDVPPEYDHFGYEIRRYMAHVGNKEVYSSEARLDQELQNAGKARIVFDYWVSDLNKKMRAMNDAFDKDPNAAATYRTTLNYNRGVVTAFQTELGAWLDNNENLLKFLYENRQMYTFEGGHIKFSESLARDAFAALFAAREKSREIIQEYSPFAAVAF